MRVFVSTRITTTESCNDNRSLAGINEGFINGLAKEALIKKGYAIAASKQDATDGLRAQLDVNLCGVSFGAVVHYSSSIGLYAISEGKSKVAPKLKEVPFNYGNAFVFAAGDPANNQSAKLKEYIKPQIINHIREAF